MSMWHQDLEIISTEELEGLCDELEMKLDEGRDELRRREDLPLDETITGDGTLNIKSTHRVVVGEHYT